MPSPELGVSFMDDLCRCGPLSSKLRVRYGSRQIKVQYFLKGRTDFCEGPGKGVRESSAEG